MSHYYFLCCVLLQYYYSTTTVLLQYYYSTTTHVSLLLPLLCTIIPLPLQCSCVRELNMHMQCFESSIQITVLNEDYSATLSSPCMQSTRIQQFLQICGVVLSKLLRSGLCCQVGWVGRGVGFP